MIEHYDSSEHKASGRLIAQSQASVVMNCAAAQCLWKPAPKSVNTTDVNTGCEFSPKHLLPASFFTC